MAWIGLQDWRCQSWSHWIPICEILRKKMCDRSSDQPTSAEVGKSTLLNKMTGSASEVPPPTSPVVGCIDSAEATCFVKVASYEFTTLTCVPGVFNYKDPMCARITWMRFRFDQKL